MINISGVVAYFKNASKFSIIIRGPKIWNHFLTNEEKNNPKILSFKRNLKNKILNFYIDLFYF